WIDPSLLSGATTVEGVVEAALRSLYPSLEMGCGARALDLAAPNGELLLLVDDVNRVPDASALVQKVAGWNGSRCRILCPVWPQVLLPLLERFRDSLEPLCLQSEGFSPKEGATAVQQRAARSGRPMTRIEAEELATDLGNDPLLIDLWGAGQDGVVKAAGVPVAFSVIERFVQGHLAALSTKEGSQYLSSEYLEALFSLARKMLEERSLVPTWPEVREWFQSDSDRLVMLRQFLKDRAICRREDESPEASLLFRHDRVRDHLLARVLRKGLEDGTVLESLLSEPHYAEVLGQALATATLEPRWTQCIAEKNPMALACALRIFRVPETTFQEAIVESLREWLRTSGESAMLSLRVDV